MYGKEREVITLKKGEVVQIIGPVVDVRFPPGNLSPIRNAIKIEDKRRNISLIAEVAQHIGNDTVRCVALASTDGLVRGMDVTDTGGPISVPVGPEVLGRIFNLLGEPLDTIGEVKTKEQMIQVAKLSAQDEELGNLIGNIIYKIGKDGVVTVENSNTFGITSETIQGLRIDKGYVAPYMTTDYERMVAEFKDAYILIVETKIATLNDIIPLYDKLVKKNINQLVIIADEYAEEVIGFMIANKLKGFFNTLAIKAPSFGDHRKNLLEDIAILTGGQVFSKEKGMKIEDITPDSLGRASKIIATKNHTTIIEGKGKQESINKRIKQIKDELSQATTSYDKEKYQERIAKLSGGISIIRVGVASEVENKEKQYRIEDAINATRSAVEEGIIEGGGVPLLRISQELNEKDPIDEILVNTLSRPFRQIIENGGEDPNKIISEIKNTDNGYDITNKKAGNMFEMGIVDPLKVTRIALENAFSVACTILTTDVLITLPKDDIKPINNQ